MNINTVNDITTSYYADSITRIAHVLQIDDTNLIRMYCLSLHK